MPFNPLDYFQPIDTPSVNYDAQTSRKPENTIAVGIVAGCALIGMAYLLVSYLPGDRAKLDQLTKQVADLKQQNTQLLQDTDSAAQLAKAQSGQLTQCQFLYGKAINKIQAVRQALQKED